MLVLVNFANHPDSVGGNKISADWLGSTRRCVEKIIDKAEAIKVFDKPFVAIGDGNNDAPMIEAAEIGIGFGGVREIAPAVLQCATHATYSEDKLCQFLKQLL